MKKLTLVFATFLISMGCSNESEDFSYINPSFSQETKSDQVSPLPIQTTRSLSFTLNSGIVDITCSYDASNEEHCTGVYRETGVAVSDDIVRELVESPMIDKKIEENLANGCENKKLVLVCDLRDEYPNLARPEGSWDNPEAKAYDQKKLESRNKVIDAFLADNPGIASEGSVNTYRQSIYSSLELTMDACDYASFIKKNKNRIYILELQGVVDIPKPNDLSCDNPIDYAILFNSEFSQGKEGSKPQHFVFSDEASFHKYLDDMKANMYEYEGFDFDQWVAPYKSISKEFDFTKNDLVVFEGGVSGGSGSPMMVTKACNTNFRVDVTFCVGKPANASLSWPIMAVRMPKGQYDFEQGNRGLVCDDNYQPIPGQVPEQIIASIDDGGICEYPTEFSILEKENLGFTREEEDWNKQVATIIRDMNSLKSYLDSLRKRHLGTDYVFDDYAEKYANFDFSQQMMIAFEGGNQPSSGYGMRIEPVCGPLVEFNVTHCSNPEISGLPDIGYPFILAAFERRDWFEFKGGSIGVECKPGE